MPKLGRQTLEFSTRPAIRGWASVVGPKEGQGPLGWCFDRVLDDDLMGQDSWELAESLMLQQALELSMEKAGTLPTSVDCMLCGDLLNQLISSALAARAIGAPFLGLYGACSTMIESTLLGSALVDAGFLTRCACGASSHFCTAERQFRFPLELGCQRPPSAQWTATAAGAVVLDAGKEPAAAHVTHGTLGRVVDYQITDANHMGAAMAPAVADTIQAHLEDTGRKDADYDRIITGDLGCIGRNLLSELLKRRGIKVQPEKLVDCGASLFDEIQDAHAGGSGCGCIASVLCGLFLRRVQEGAFRRILVVGSGALLSTTSSQQGESIPGIAYAVAIERGTLQ